MLRILLCPKISIMKLKSFTLFLFCFTVFQASAQMRDSTRYGNSPYYNKEKERDENDLSGLTFAQRCYAGGNLSLNLGTYGSYIEVSPIFGYALTPALSVGVGTTYKYFSGFSGYSGSNYSTSAYGVSTFARLLLGERFLAQAEFETINTDAWDIYTRSFTRKWIPVGCAGLGMRQGSDYNAYSYFLLMYDFIGDPNSPYPYSPFILKAGLVFPIAR